MDVDADVPDLTFADLLAMITFERQMCAHPAGIAKEKLEEKLGQRMTERLRQEVPRKFEAVLHHLRERVGPEERCLVFSFFRGACDSLAAYLEEKGFPCRVVNGDTTQEERARIISNFQGEGPPGEPRPRVLISTFCLNEGVTLTAANHVIFLTPWWNGQKEHQGYSRAHRLGQKKDVHVVHLVIRGSVEEKMLQMSKEKKELGTKVGTNLSVADLKKLLFGNG